MIEVAKKSEIDMLGIGKACQIVRNNLSELSFENKRLALAAFNVKVTLDGNRIVIDGAIPKEELSIASTSRRRYDVATGMNSGENQI
ncbi:hypothetical protein ACFLVG_00025 [Chloroflexota bacterium]